MGNVNVSPDKGKALEGEKKVYKLPYQQNLLFNFFSVHAPEYNPKEKLVFLSPHTDFNSAALAKSHLLLL